MTRLSSIDYHAHPAISKSGLDLIAKSPAHYIASRQQPREVTPSMRQGSALHTMILEPELWPTLYGVRPPMDRRTTAGKQAAAAWDEQHRGLEPVTFEEYDRWSRCADAVRNHPACSFLFSKGEAERSFFAHDPVTGQQVKARPDWLAQVESSRLYVELKSTTDAKPQSFARSAWNFRYHVQPAFYYDVIEWSGEPPPDGTIIIAFEPEPPFGIMVYEPTARWIERGREDYRRDLDLYHHCVTHNDWPGYPPEVQSLDLPAWA